MKALERNLYSRNGNLYYRSAIPRHLHQILSIREIVISLKVTDRHEARVKAAQLNQAERGIIEGFHQQLRGMQGVIPETVITGVLERLESLKHNSAGKVALSLQAYPESRNGQKTASLLFSDFVQRYMADCT